jgi:hypothetical protein
MSGAVGLHAGRQRGDALKQCGVRLVEGGARCGVRRVEDRAVHEDDAHVLERVVGVLLDPAAHARRVVRHDASDHTAIDRRGVGPDLVLCWG